MIKVTGSLIHCEVVIYLLDSARHRDVAAALYQQEIKT